MRRADRHDAGEAVLAQPLHGADAVDVALHDVPAQAVGGAHGQLEVDPRAGLDRTDRAVRAASRA